MHNSNEESLRRYYELKVSKSRVADSHWWRIKNIFKDANLQLSEKNIDSFLELKKYCPRYTAKFALVSKKVRSFTNYVSCDKVSGSYFCNYLMSQNINPSQSTISRWFTRIGGFNKNRIYPIKDLTHVAISAFVYQVKLGDLK